MKALIVTKPTGINLIAEIDIFYPLPDKWRLPKHKPKIPLPPPPSPPPPPPPPEHIISMDDIQHFQHDHPGEVFMPPGGWENNIFDNLKSAPSMVAKEKYWEDNVNISTNKTNLTLSTLINLLSLPVPLILSYLSIIKKLFGFIYFDYSQKLNCSLITIPSTITKFWIISYQRGHTLIHRDKVILIMTINGTNILNQNGITIMLKSPGRGKRITVTIIITCGVEADL